MLKLFDPLIFNKLIMTLYAVNAIQFAARGIWADASYWVCALGITATVTFLYKH